MSNQIQPAGNITPVSEEKQIKEDETLSNPAKKDYKEGRDFFDKGDYNQAATCLHNALIGFEKQEDNAGVANASDRLGDVCLAKNEFQMAIDNFLRAFEICKKEEDSFSLLALNKKIAAAYKKMGQLDKALEILFDIIEHYRLMRNPKGTVEILEVIAEVYLENGDKEKAADTYRTISSIHSNFQHARLAEDYEARAGIVDKL